MHNDKCCNLTLGKHAQERKLQGRNVGMVMNVLQRARDSDIFMQEDGRYVIRGATGK